ncbi:MAG: hypothetical protein KME45_24730 [Stenomitos rutilans HA7619-LM2]|nr:hypothetical protein [Stenomitos rutilans HA7619-LM2]
MSPTSAPVRVSKTGHGKRAGDGGIAVLSAPCSDLLKLKGGLVMPADLASLQQRR